MQYLLMIYAEEGGWNAMPPEAQKAGVAAYTAYTEALRKAGVLLGSNRLKDTDTATTVRLANGRTIVEDGPFAETKEQLGGYYLIEASDLDEALKWADKIPLLDGGKIEVRPVWGM